MPTSSPTPTTPKPTTNPGAGKQWVWNGTAWISVYVGSTPTPTPASPTDVNEISQITPGSPTGNTTQMMGITDWAGQVAVNPSLALYQDDPATTGVNESMELSDRVPTVSATDIASGTQSSAPAQGTPGALEQTAAQGTASTANGPTSTDAQNVNTQLTQPDIVANQTAAAQASVNPQSVVTAAQTDVEGAANGTTVLGGALDAAAQQKFVNIIDTNTLAGKLLAEQLGEGNYTDSKATLKGQLDILAAEFQNTDGSPKIPSWAAGVARNVGKIAAFRGMTGTAATAAMAQALLEASIPVAQQDAQFFQTLTIKNLDNRQQSTINKANVLSKMDLANLDNRMAAAVQNASAFMQMDLKNLDNRQQANVIDSQARVQSILEDAKSINTSRLFMAESQQELDKFYAELGSQIEQFNTAQKNQMSQYNSSEQNDMSQFNADIENQREQFYKNMQFNIDTANAKWRQEITMTENTQKFEAASTDVKNMVAISVEQLNRLWDRSDALLDYVWKSGESEADRKAAIAMAKLQADIALTAADNESGNALLGTLLGAAAGAFFDWIF
jgi:hypothetical protein